MNDYNDDADDDEDGALMALDNENYDWGDKKNDKAFSLFHFHS